MCCRCFSGHVPVFWQLDGVQPSFSWGPSYLSLWLAAVFHRGLMMGFLDATGGLWDAVSSLHPLAMMIPSEDPQHSAPVIKDMPESVR